VVFEQTAPGRYVGNSMFVSLSVTLGVLLTSSLAGYSFSRLNFPGRDKIFLMYLGTMMIPGSNCILVLARRLIHIIVELTLTGVCF